LGVGLVGLGLYGRVGRVRVRRQTTTTDDRDASEQNNTGPLGGPVINQEELFAYMEPNIYYLRNLERQACFKKNISRELSVKKFETSLPACRRKSGNSSMAVHRNDRETEAVTLDIRDLCNLAMSRRTDWGWVLGLGGVVTQSTMTLAPESLEPVSKDVCPVASRRSYESNFSMTLDVTQLVPAHLSAATRPLSSAD